MAHRLIVVRLVGVAIHDVIREWRAVIRFGALPLSCAAILQWAYALSAQVGRPDPGTELVASSITTLPYVFFAVPFYRHLFGQRVDRALQWSTAHSVFLTWSVAKAAAWAVGGLLLADELSPLLIPPLAYVFARFCLVIPASAGGSYPDLQLAWALSRGNGWRLVAIRFLVWLLAFAPTMALAWATVTLGARWDDAFRIFSAVAMIIVEVLGVATLSRCLNALRESAAGSFAVDPALVGPTR